MHRKVQRQSAGLSVVNGGPRVRESMRLIALGSTRRAFGRGACVRIDNAVKSGG